MKKIILLFITSIFSINGFAQAPYWQWAQGATSVNFHNDFSNHVATDGNGNVYITGQFDSPTLVFGATTLTNAGATDVFIAKYNSAGNLLWAKQAGGIGSDKAYSICTDGNGGVYITGEFVDTITFDSVNLISSGYSDAFIAKYDALGNALWAKKGGGVSGNDYSHDVNTDVNGNVYITGYSNSNSITFETVTLGGAGGFFVTKYNSVGALIWARRVNAVSAGNAEGRAITTDMYGNVFVTGFFQSNSIILGTDTLVNANTNYSADIFIVKLDTSGNAVWSIRAGGTNFDYPYGISIRNANLYITGTFRSSSILFGTTTLTNAYAPGGQGDIFAAKCDTSGNVLWAKKAGKVNDDVGQAITIDGNENLYITGTFAYPSIIFGTDTLINAGGSSSSAWYDIFVVKYDSSGNVLWAKGVGGIYNDGASGIAIDGNYNIYITGYFASPSITFGATTLNNIYINGGYLNILTAKLDTNLITYVPLISSQESIFLFPNPTNSQISITNNQSSIKEIEMYSSLGEKVFQKHLSSDIGHLSISVADFTRGIYFITVTDQTGNKVTRKVVKM